MSDRSTDRYSLPDESAIIRGGADAGVVGKWDNIYHSEELGGEDFISPKDRVRGGGEGGIGKLFTQPEEVDPELLSLYREFIADKRLPMYVDSNNSWLSLVPRDMDESEASEIFTKWLDDKDSDVENKNSGTVQLNLSRVGYDTKEYDKLTSLLPLWKDPQTGVAYKFGDDGLESDKLVFVNEDKIEDINVSDFNRALESSGIRMRIERPRRGDKDKQAMGVLHRIRLGVGVFKGDSFAVEGSPKNEKPKEKAKTREVVDENAYGLTLNQAALNKLTKDLPKDAPQSDKDEADKINNAVNEFWGIWTHGKDQIEALGFGVDNARNKINTVIMKLKDGTSVTIPSYIFRTVFKGAKPYTDRVSGDVSGFEFSAASGKKGFIHPKSPPEMIEAVMKRVQIDGKKLNPNIRFFIGPYDTSDQKGYDVRPEFAKENK